MVMVKTENATERSDLHHRLVYSAVKSANSKSVSEVERCFDTLRYLKNMKLSVTEICHSEAVHVLESLRHHQNPKIRTEVELVFDSWRNTLFSHGRDNTTCNKALPLNRKKPNVLKSCSVLKKKGPLQRSHDIAAERKKKTDFLGLKKHQDQISKTHDQVDEIKQNLNKADDCKSFAARAIQTKKQSALPLKGSENPRSVAHETAEIKQNLKKSGVCKSVIPTSRPLQMKKQPPLKVSGNPKYCPKKNTTEMLELFEIAKKSADVANAKGLLAAKVESSVCVDTLSLLINYPISSTANETRLIMEKLERLTKHKDRKICNSASALVQHWRQSIRDQQHKDVKLKDTVTSKIQQKTKEGN